MVTADRLCVGCATAANQDNHRRLVFLTIFTFLALPYVLLHCVLLLQYSWGAVAAAGLCLLPAHTLDLAPGIFLIP
jgi:hypothetical protein